jgi:hypothetical protein
MKPVLLAVTAILVTACGSASVSRPPVPAPRSGTNSPPPAWLETQAGSRWLGFSTSCWHPPKSRTGVCADMVIPKCSQQSVPTLPIGNGETVRAHLGYEPEEASVEHEDAKLDGRTVQWRVGRPGVFVLFTRGREGDASYSGCAVLR